MFSYCCLLLGCLVSSPGSFLVKLLLAPPLKPLSAGQLL